MGNGLEPESHPSEDVSFFEDIPIIWISIIGLPGVRCPPAPRIYKRIAPPGASAGSLQLPRFSACGAKRPLGRTGMRVRLAGPSGRPAQPSNARRACNIRNRRMCHALSFQAEKILTACSIQRAVLGSHLISTLGSHRTNQYPGACKLRN